LYAEKPVQLNGIVTAVQWKNPHVLVFVDVKDESGSVVNWKVEWLSAMILFQQGFSRDSPHVGDQINMTACVAKDGSHTAAAQFGGREDRPSNSGRDDPRLAPLSGAI
jgi:hypothetical protein